MRRKRTRAFCATSSGSTAAGRARLEKSKKARREAAKKQIEQLLMTEGMDVDEDEKPNGVNGVSKSAKAKGKMPASDSDEDEDEDSDSEGEEVEEFVLCTLDPTKVCSTYFAIATKLLTCYRRTSSH